MNLLLDEDARRDALRTLRTLRPGRLGSTLSTLGGLVAEPRKKARYARSFLAKRLVHTNLQVLYNCNFRCGICDFWQEPHRSRPQIALDDVRVISRKLAEIGPQIVSIGGGEPLLHKDIVEIVAVLAEHHFPVMICNGWFVTPEMARALFEAGIYEVSVSVDYADAARHDAQRATEGAWERAVEALRILDQSRVTPWQRVHMISVVMRDNLDQIEPLIRLSDELGITYLVTLYSVARGRPDDRRADDLRVSAELLRLKERYPGFVQLQGYLARFSEAVAADGVGPCYAGKNLCNIDCDGNVSLCIDRLDDTVGSILTEDARTIERRLLEKQQANTCTSCWTSCRGAIETLMYGDAKLANARDYFQMTRPVPLRG